MSLVRRRPRRALLATLGLLAYLAGLAVVGLWPTGVDSGADRIVDAVLNAVPLLTYARLEWLANVLLFVPLGLFGALMPHRPQTAIVVVPLAGLLVSSLIETAQSLLLPGRLGSVLDVIANTLGTVIGCLIGIGLVLLEERRRTRARARSGATHAPVDPAGLAPRRGIEAVAPVDDDPSRDELPRVLG